MRTSSLLLSSLLIAAACGDNGDDNATEADVATDAGEQLGQQHADQADVELGSDEAPAVLAQAGSIMLTIDEGEIMHAQLALDIADDDEAVAYANRMLVEHTAHVAKTGMVLSALSVEPQDNPISMTLRQEAMAGAAELQASDDVGFEYMRMQVKMHAEAFVVVGALERLAPAPDAKQFFAETKATIATHRMDAAMILRNW